MIRGAALTAVLATAFASAAFANSSNGVQQITSAGIHDSGNAEVVFPTAQHSESCGGNPPGTTLIISKTNPNFKEMYATALVAMTTGRSVLTWANGCVDLWGNGSNLAPQMTVILLQ
jgi:hypothetical protein